MSLSLKRKFRGNEAYVVSLIRQMGVSNVMLIYGLKNRKSFLRWFGENSVKDLPKEPLEGMSGGQKHKWLIDHRDTILDCLQVFGEDWVKMNFHFTHDTLYSFIRFSEPPRPNPNGQIDQLLKDFERLKSRCEIEHGDYIEVIEGQKQLKQLVLNFAQGITQRLAQVIAKPLLEHIIGSGSEKLNPEFSDDKHRLDLNLVESETTPKSSDKI